MKLLVATLVVLLSISSAQAQYNEKNLKLEPSAVQQKFLYGNLQLYPIRANDFFLKYHQSLGSYTTLSEALEKKKVVITEHVDGPHQDSNFSASGAEVNTLFIENISSDTVLILSGELIQGGQQDRMIAKDFILLPKSGKKDISVFCVEHGRWSGQVAGQAYGESISFKKTAKFSNAKVRKAAAVDKDQQKVWDEVAVTTEKNKVSTGTGTLLAMSTSTKVNTDLKKYTEHFKPLFTDADIIGVVAVSGDSILGCDMFATHSLFEKHAENLIHSYASEAITSGKTVSVPYEKVRLYLNRIIMDESKQESDLKKNGTMLKNNGKKIHLSKFR